MAAAAQTKNPVRQALVSSTGTFWDTVVVCAMTGLVLVNSGEWIQGLNGSKLTDAAFSDFPIIGPAILTVGLLMFIFSTILGCGPIMVKRPRNIYSIPKRFSLTAGCG